MCIQAGYNPVGCNVDVGSRTVRFNHGFESSGAVHCNERTPFDACVCFRQYLSYSACKCTPATALVAMASTAVATPSTAGAGASEASDMTWIGLIAAAATVTIVVLAVGTRPRARTVEYRPQLLVGTAATSSSSLKWDISAALK